MIIGAYVRGLSDRDIESLLEEAGLGKLSRSTASRICQELRARYAAFRAELGQRPPSGPLPRCHLPADATAEPRRASWWHGVTPSRGERVLLDVCLGQCERHEDWLEMGRGLVRRGLRAPWLSVIDGAPGLIKAVEELWPDGDHQRRTVHRLRNMIVTLPKRPEIIDRVR